MLGQFAMNEKIWGRTGKCVTAQCLGIFIVLASATTPVFALETEDDLRLMANMLVRIESAAEKRDRPAVCSITANPPGAHEYRKRVCESGVRQGAIKPEECSEAGLKLQAKRELDDCLGSSPADFDDLLKTWATARQDFLNSAAAKGLNGEAMMAEARAKLR